MSTGIRMYLAAIAVAAMFLPQTSFAAGGRGGAVFAMTNDANKNEVIAYERSESGKLLESNRFETGGRGSGGLIDPLASQGSLTLSQDHSVLFAVNAGSGNVSVFSVHRSALVLVDKASSGGSEPVAVAEHQNLVYVLNAAGAGSLVGFTLDFGGHLRPIKGSTTFLTATASGAASVKFSPNGKFLVVTEKAPNNIDLFQVKQDGTLTPIVVNHDQNPGTFAANFAPNGALIVSETGPAGTTGEATISSFNVLPNGTISTISSGVHTDGTANCWNAITPDGKFVYVSNAGTSSVSGFAIGANGTLTPIGGTVVGNNPQGSTNLDIAVSADGKFVYTLNSGSGDIGVFEIEENGSLASLGTAGEFPKAQGFNGIAAL